jgi:hypothetical protein
MVVMRAVRRGERAPDPWLAPEVLAYAQVIVHTAERGQRKRWVLWIPTAVIVVNAASATGRIGARSAYLWAVVAVVVSVAWRLPRIYARWHGNAAEAARLARQQMNGFSPE